jgi:catechol 2,3-dioxygenase-like lactoylglutathione lyase family enzyme
MALQLRRVILFTPRLAEMTIFYRDILGLEVAGQEDGWVDFAAGACSLALHVGPSKVGNRPPKLAFYAEDVAGARADLLKRGLAVAGPVKSTGRFDMCDCKDPDGNPFQISSRR